MVLAGDIGGTNCRLTLFKVAAGGEREEVIFQKVCSLLEGCDGSAHNGTCAV